MAALTGSAALAAPADPESFNAGKIDMDRFKGLFPSHIKCVAVLTPASVPGEEKCALQSRCWNVPESRSR